METYESKLKSHILSLESFSYSNMEKSFKNCHKNLAAGGTLFIKEWCSVENETQESKENIKLLEDVFFYYPKKLSTLLNLADRNGFRLIDEKNLLHNINTIPYGATLPYHYDAVKNFKFPHDVETIFPVQLKFRKK